MNNEEFRRMQRQGREVQRWLDRNPGVFDGIAAAQQALHSVERYLLPAIEQYARTVDAFARPMGDLSLLRAITRTAGEIVVRFVQALPPNWPGEMDFESAIDIANEGIPVVWVPSAAIMSELVAADDYDARLAVLHTHVEELRQDIRQTLDEVTHVELAGQVPLARRAVDAWDAGYHEAAQVLAVTVVEAAISRHFADGRRYLDVREAAKLDLDTADGVIISELRFAVAVAPIWSFYTPWHPNKGEPAPEALSRHVTIHQANISHYTPNNALIAMLLQASVLRALQELLEQRDLEAQERAAEHERIAP
jgi:hypothetical protein